MSDIEQQILQDIEQIEVNPAQVVQAKITELSTTISALPNREPTTPENVDMKQHLINVRTQWETDSATMLIQEKERLEQKLQSHREMKDRIAQMLTQHSP